MVGIKRSELLSSLSGALDLTEGQPDGHAIRCSWIGVNIGLALGLSPSGLQDLYYTLLLKDVGCSSNAARICKLFLTDDLSFKRDVKTVGDKLPAFIGFLISHTGTKAGFAQRLTALVHAFKESGTLAKELIETRCQRGADIVRRMRFSEAVAQGILDLDEHWDGKGQPLGLNGANISLYARIALLAQVVDVFFMTAGAASAKKEVLARSATWLDPTLTAVFAEVSSKSNFWNGLIAPDLAERTIQLLGGEQEELVDDDYLDDIAEAFADVIDSKSPFTAGHSRRVALFCDMIATQMNLSQAERRLIKRAGLLHDIGKLGVSNQILDKPGKLSDDEMTVVKTHPVLGEKILSRVAAFSDIARLAGTHHERLDGNGYPYGLQGSDIGLLTRILSTADVFDALTADRPYRAALPVAKVLEIMWQSAGSAIDPICIKGLQSGLKQLEMAAE